MWIHKVQMTRTVRNRRTRADTDGSVSRQRRCPGTTKTVLFLGLVMTDHEPQQALYTKKYCFTDRQIRGMTCMWIEISFLENASIEGVVDCVLPTSLHSSAV